MVTVMAYVLIVVFMVLIMKKKLTPFVALAVVPLLFAIAGSVMGLWSADIGKFAFEGLKTTSVTALMLIFAVLFFTTMIDAGLFDPMSNAMIRFAKGDPLKVMAATVLLSTGVSLNGDGTSTMIIVCSAFVPIYKKLNMKMLDLAVLTILSHSIMNLLPWGGPTARVIVALGLNEAEVLRGLLPIMVVAEIFVLIVAIFMGISERKRLGVTTFTDAQLQEMMTIVDPEIQNIRRPKLVWINFIIVAVAVAMLVEGSIKSVIVFLVGTTLALLVNYPDLKEQRARIEANAADALQVGLVIVSAGIFMGILNGTGMAKAISMHMTTVIPASLGQYWGLFTGIIACFGTVFLSNDAFYYGVLPVLAKAGYNYGFTPLQLGFASLYGQAFHLLSPLVPFIYVLLRLTDVDMWEWQKKSALVGGIGIFILYVIVGSIVGLCPISL